jgi:aminoglycoside phosphotransferase (APT) family kinase protein
VNAVLLLAAQHGRAVLKVNVRDPNDPKVAAEAWVLEFLARALPLGGWRVPRVIGTDTSREALPYDYLLLEHLPGQMGSSAWERGGRAERESLAHQMGCILRQLHAFQVPGEQYGGWNAATRGFGTSDDWQALVQRENGEWLAGVANCRALNAARLDAVRQWLGEHLEAVPRKPRRALAHHDMGPWNTLVQRDRTAGLNRRGAPFERTAGSDGTPVRGPTQPAWRITAVLDFEWSGVASPASEFASFVYDPVDPAAPPALFDAYLGGEPCSPAFRCEVEYHVMRYHLALLPVTHRYWGGEGAQEHEAGIARLLRGEPAHWFAAAGYGWPF